ncbi:MAG TPA: EF-hand domain-containing protein [Gemmataceae bacterium]|jgi:Ca2+-binding EF-hand superfamily protein
MKNLLFFAALTALLAFGLSARAAPKAADGRDAQDFVFMGEKGPVLIRFHVRIDGKPLVDVWEDFMGKLFAYLDLDGDGVLSKSEAARVPPIPVLFSNGGGFAAQQPNLVESIDKDRDGKITRQELADWYRRNGAASFQFPANGPRQNQVTLTSFAGQAQPLSPDALNEKLFKLLDADKDGKLSREELARAPAVLAKMDLDDDETVSIQEMSGNAPSSVESNVVFAINQQMQPARSDPFVMVVPGQGGKQLARDLLAHYAPKGKRSAVRKLTRQALGMEEAAFARLDADEDGTLDTEELARFAQREPDLEFRVRLGKNAGVELVSGKDRPSAKGVRPSSSGTLLWELDSTQIELGSGDTAGEPQIAARLRQQYLAQFRAADADNNGYLDKNEADRNPLYRNAFKMMDRDGDGKLFEKEVAAYLDKMKELQEAAVKSCASLAVKDQGRGLFDMVDGNNDGRLGVRELRQMVKLVDQLDRDGDGRISAGEIPHKYRVDVRRGPTNGNQSTSRVVAVRRMAVRGPDLPERTAGPLWFRKMDRNHDGDVSRREFLGTDAEFRRIDADGDGLISVEEADRADKLLRKEKEQKP